VTGPGRFSSGPLLSLTIPTGWLVAALAATLGVCQLLLWRFLNIAPLWAYPLALLLIAALCLGIARSTARLRPPPEGPTLATLLVCLLIALVLFLLGGEGHVFYSNVDWQVRNAVLRDMSIHPWPFVYTARAAPDVLRAPLGMFFAPALVFKLAGQRAADIALLVQNAAVLGVVLTLASRLFIGTRHRIVALAVFLAFSGLDIVGQLLFRGPLVENLEFWSGLQFSSTVTLAFWVPQHALAGWIGAVAFLLWSEGKISAGATLSLLPLTALWSPLALMGTLPFAALVGLKSLHQRNLEPADVFLPLAATLLAIPSLLYLGAANHEVGIRLYHIDALIYAVFEAIEVMPYVIPITFFAVATRAGVTTILITAVCLLTMPFIQIGWSTDFMMRASIPALSILAVLVAKRLNMPGGGGGKICLSIALLIGSVTGLSEIVRAVRYPPSPQVSCSFFGAWDQNFARYPKGSYLAPLHEMPALVRPAIPTRITSAEPPRCWAGEWHVPGRF
jgi:hypothetical protein